MHALLHAETSALRFGGTAEDYLAIHRWLDSSREHLGDFRHRAMYHHTAGVVLAQQIFGVEIVTADGRRVPVQDVAELHIRQDLGCLPTPADWLRELRPALWMQRGRATRKLVIAALRAGEGLPG